MAEGVKDEELNEEMSDDVNRNDILEEEDMEEIDDSYFSEIYNSYEVISSTFIKVRVTIGNHVYLFIY